MAEKLAIGDFTNYADLNEDTISKWGWTKVNDANASSNPWFERSTVSRDNQISKYYPCNGGESLRVKADIFTSVYGQASNGGTATATARGVGIMMFVINADGSRSYISSTRVTASSTSGTTSSISSIVTLPTTARLFAVYVQIDGYPSFSGALRVRNVQVNKMYTGELIVDGSIKTSHISTSGLNASVITAGTIDASKINVTNLNASNITSGKITADNIDTTDLSVSGELISGEINGLKGIRFDKSAVIKRISSGLGDGVYGIEVSAPVVKLGGRVRLSHAEFYYELKGYASEYNAISTTWTMSENGDLTCKSATTSGQLKGGSLSVSGTSALTGNVTCGNNLTVYGAIYGTNMIAFSRSSLHVPNFAGYVTMDYMRIGSGFMGCTDGGVFHFITNSANRSIQLASGASLYLPHSGRSVESEMLRLGAGIMGSPSSGSFHFLTATGYTSPLYAGILYSSSYFSETEPMNIYEESVFDDINSINVISTSKGLRLYNPITTTSSLDESTNIVKTSYNEEKEVIETTIDHTSAIATMWKAIQELKQENERLNDKLNEMIDILKDKQ